MNRSGGDQEKIPGTYGGVGGCLEHRFWDFFLPILGFFLKENHYFLNNFINFFCVFAIFASNFELFLLKENQVRCQYQVREWYIEKCRLKNGESNF